ncbi:Bug family tripartite tricarboxylate transporter substrate binding protein [Ramlibacter sp.]|uniref:Bug family tripartite tricarboxylate transporter substrate binding protein n=1 Tax=Ramlibacter sp. TaxID=1917967 RepID=UPI003D0DD48C
MTTRRQIILGAAAAAGLLAQRTAFAQEWAPTRPITVVVPYPPGGLLDGIARKIGEKMAVSLKQAVVIDNKPGANTMIGAQLVSKAPADGHTLLFGTDATISISPFLYRKVAYEASDFVPITLVADTVECLIANPKVPATNMREFAAWAKREGKKINFGTYGIGSNAHLSTAELEHMIGTEMNHIPYKGQADLYQALLTGDIQFVVGTTGIATQYIQDGRLKLIAPLRQKRAPQFPNTPSATEQGFQVNFPGAWFGYLAPAKTPPAAIQRLAREIRAAAEDPDLQANSMVKMGLEPAAFGTEAMTRRLEGDRVRYKTLIDRLQLKLD